MGSTPTEAPWLALLSSSKRAADASPLVVTLSYAEKAGSRGGKRPCARLRTIEDYTS
jgi:hypothetical protein